MSSAPKCFGQVFPELNMSDKPIDLHQIEPKQEDASAGALSLSPDTPEERIKELFLSRAHSDLKITLHKSGEYFEVHKLILSLTSPIFSRMFGNEIDSIMLDDDPDAMKWILMHAYFGYSQIPPKVSDIIILHETLHKYAMSEMAMKCLLILRNSVNIETLDEIYAVSLKFKDNLLKRRCLEEIQKSGDKLLDMASNGNMSSDLFLNVLQSENLKTTEMDIFKTVMKWAKIKAKNNQDLDIKTFLKPYLREVDFLSMTQNQILGPISDEEIFTNEEIVGILLASKNITDYDVSEYPFLSVLMPSSYPMYLRDKRRNRRFFHPQINGCSIQIFMYLKCDHKGNWINCGHYPILTLQVSEEIYITRIRARPECFVGDNFIEIVDHDTILGSSTLCGPPWDFNPPVEIGRKRSYVINLNGKGKICRHEFRMFSKTQGNLEICGNSILCDVAIRYMNF